VTKILQEFFRGRDWWREVLRFYIGLSGKPRELERWLVAGKHSINNLEQNAEPNPRSEEQYRVLLESLSTYYPGVRLRGA